MEESQAGQERKCAGSMEPCGNRSLEQEVSHLRTLLRDALLWLRAPEAPNIMRGENFWIERHKIIIAIEETL